METIGKIATWFFVILICAIINGFTFAQLWFWFFVNKFSLPELSFTEAYGVALTVTFLTTQVKKDDEDNKDFSETLIHSFVLCLLKSAMFLIFGWVAYCLV